ncbi:phosphoribosylglycinamide formyltransferase [Acuticoccus sp. M5D2P5]|uniref:phosphoribosylglycinamide formyltransferase n=1 Tax=Acuticoccus kalidii TaxID=2910977 RepID=UPI001F1EBFA0|nr:phosphoribosylglycinamide formyltransferase [Acuticoccus kalidii]MCF3934504.1 phosphoribosylglycinamide formyltransferase [Acuticoccus kalidii]
MTEKTPIAVFVSGRGSNFLALAEAAADPAYPARIALVVSDKPDAAALTRAAEIGIATAVVERRGHPSKASFDAALEAEVLKAGAQQICLAGFMRILGPEFVGRWEGRMLNIHPSLLPSFRGLETHRRALEAGVKFHGVTVHLVTAELDDGPIIAQAAIPVLPDDTEDTLAARVLGAEHKLYPAALAVHLSGAAHKPLAAVHFNPPLWELQHSEDQSALALFQDPPTDG